MLSGLFPFPGSHVQEAAFYFGPFIPLLSPWMPVKRYVRNVSLQIVINQEGQPARWVGPVRW